VPALESDRYYRWIVYLSIPLIYLTLAFSAWYAVTANLSVVGYFALALAMGWTGGAGINAGHELGHKKTGIERMLARFALAPTGYGHFNIEHNRGHHRDVATPGDPASVFRVLEDEVLALLRQATIAANDAVYLARQKRESDMGTTLTTAYIRDNRLFVTHVGDCRAYRFNADGLEQLTTDHSVVANMIAEGQIEPEEIYTHPHRSIVTRCIGDKPVVEVDTNLLPLTPGDRLILCCDGLWEMVRTEGIEDVLMQEADSQTACDLLVQNANAAGGEDNISVIVVQVEAMAEMEED